MASFYSWFHCFLCFSHKYRVCNGTTSLTHPEHFSFYLMFWDLDATQGGRILAWNPGGAGVWGLFSAVFNSEPGKFDLVRRRIESNCLRSNRTFFRSNRTFPIPARAGCSPSDQSRHLTFDELNTGYATSKDGTTSFVMYAAKEIENCWTKLEIWKRNTGNTKNSREKTRRIREKNTKKYENS